MLVADVFSHQALQMPLAEDDHVVEQISAAISDPTLGDTVLPRTTEAGSLRLDADALHSLDHFVVELCPAIKNQVAGRRVVWECLAQLLDDPGAGRMFGHIAMRDLPPVMRNDKEAVQHAKGERRKVKKSIAAMASR